MEFLKFLKEYAYIPAIVLALFGWWWVHKLNAKRDRINAERSLRVTELANAYSILLRVGIYGTLTKEDDSGRIIWINEELEDAIGKIYLYGTKRQVLKITFSHGPIQMAPMAPSFSMRSASTSVNPWTCHQFMVRPAIFEFRSSKGMQVIPNSSFKPNPLCESA